jgi:hypothetical protein
MSQQSVRQASRRSALDAQAVPRKKRADRERRLEGLAAAVLTALAERDGLVRDAERRPAEGVGDPRRGRMVRWRDHASRGEAFPPTGEQWSDSAAALRGVTVWVGGELFHDRLPAVRGRHDQDCDTASLVGVLVALGAPAHLLGFGIAQLVSTAAWPIAILGSVSLGAGLA